MIGILNIDKPKGMTSSDVVARVRKILGTKAVGHFGTLDPMGEGVLLIGVGKATRLFDFLLGKDKVYEAEFKFGIETDTLDTDGKVEKECPFVPSIDEVNSVLPSLKGVQMQVPPIYSAKSLGGKRAYELARKGISVELKPCKIEIYDLSAESASFQGGVKLNIHCSSGTYVRSIGRDLAYKLGTCASMCMIRRLRCGPFELTDAVGLNDLEIKKESAILPVESALAGVAKVELAESYYESLLNGTIPNVENDGTFALYCKGELFGLARKDEYGRVKITSYLRG